MITIEQIDEFRKRTNSSYEDARAFLEKNNGDILDAIIDFERTKSGSSKTHQNKKKQQSDFGTGFAEMLQKGFDMRIVVEDKGSTLFTFPVILLFLLIPIWILAGLFFVFLIILGYKVSIKEIKSGNVNVESIFKNINERVKETNVNKDGGKEQTHKNDVNQHTDGRQKDFTPAPVQTDVIPFANTEAPKPEKEEEGYNEYTIE